MEGLKGCALDSVGNAIRKKRSNMPRHPRVDDITGYASTFRCVLGVSAVDKFGDGGEFGRYKRSIKDDMEHQKSTMGGNFENGCGSGSDFVRCIKGTLAPANWKSIKSVEENLELHSRKDHSMGNVSNIVESQSVGNSGLNSYGLGNENKLRKLKLKVGGVTHIIHAKPTSNGSSGGGFGSSSMKTSQSVDASRPHKKRILQDTSDDDKSSSEAVCKSKRVPQPRLLDAAFDDGNDDEETRYLERLKHVLVLYNDVFLEDKTNIKKIQDTKSQIFDLRVMLQEMDMNYTCTCKVTFLNKFFFDFIFVTTRNLARRSRNTPTVLY